MVIAHSIRELLFKCYTVSFRARTLALGNCWWILLLTNFIFLHYSCAEYTLCTWHHLGAID